MTFKEGSQKPVSEGWFKLVGNFKFRGVDAKEVVEASHQSYRHQHCKIS